MVCSGRVTTGRARVVAVIVPFFHASTVFEFIWTGLGWRRVRTLLVADGGLHSNELDEDLRGHLKTRIA